MGTLRSPWLWVFALLVSSAAWPAQEQTYPSKPIRFIAPFSPGGGSDYTARLFAQKLGERFKQSVIVDNRPGAGGDLGTAIAIAAPPDGYTLLVVAGSYAANVVVHRPSYDPINAIAPIIQFTKEPSIFMVNPLVPAKTLQELLDLANKQPNKLSYGSSGVGGLAHLSLENFLDAAKIKMTHVPYKGTGPALNDLIAGNIQFMSAGAIIAMPLVKSGRLRAMAVTSLVRIPVVPDIPTVSESGVPGYEKSIWHGLLAPKNTPRVIIDRVNAALNESLKTKDIEDRFYAGGIMAAGGTPEVFLAQIKSDIAACRAVVQRLNIKVE